MKQIHKIVLLLLMITSAVEITSSDTSGGGGAAVGVKASSLTEKQKHFINLIRYGSVSDVKAALPTIEHFDFGISSPLNNALKRSIAIMKMLIASQKYISEKDQKGLLDEAYKKRKKLIAKFEISTINKAVNEKIYRNEVSRITQIEQLLVNDGRFEYTATALADRLAPGQVPVSCAGGGAAAKAGGGKKAGAKASASGGTRADLIDHFEQQGVQEAIFVTGEDSVDNFGGGKVLLLFDSGGGGGADAPSSSSSSSSNSSSSSGTGADNSYIDLLCREEFFMAGVSGDGAAAAGNDLAGIPEEFEYSEDSAPGTPVALRMPNDFDDDFGGQRKRSKRGAEE